MHDDRIVYVRITSEFDCTPERAWTELLRTRLLEYVVRPLVVFEPLDPDPLPTLWSEGEYLVRIRLFGRLPLGTHTIRIGIPTVETTPGSQRYQLRDDGSGTLLSTWDHRITIEETADGRTRYTDDVEVRAGLLTPLFWLLAQLLYRHRQRRWGRLVRNGYDYSR